MTSEQPTLLKLPECGISEAITVLGTMKVLQAAKGSPVVFLFDEFHCDKACISENVANAHELVKKCGITLVAVESEYGGYTWDIESECYTKDRGVSLLETFFPESREKEFDPGDSKILANDCPQFGDEMRRLGANVLGVECRGLSEALECAHAATKAPISDHHFNLKRSKHFLRTLFDLQTHHALAGNLILNTGANHNTHIENWILSGEIDEIAGRKASYIRLRPPSYPEIGDHV